MQTRPCCVRLPAGVRLLVTGARRFGGGSAGGGGGAVGFAGHLGRAAWLWSGGLLAGGFGLCGCGPAWGGCGGCPEMGAGGWGFGGWGGAGVKGVEGGVAVGIADVGGEVFEEVAEFRAGARGEGALALDGVHEAAELLFGAGEGAHGVKQGVEPVGDLEGRGGWAGGSRGCGTLGRAGSGGAAATAWRGLVLELLAGLARWLARSPAGCFAAGLAGGRGGLRAGGLHRG